MQISKNEKENPKKKNPNAAIVKHLIYLCEFLISSIENAHAQTQSKWINFLATWWVLSIIGSILAIETYFSFHRWKIKWKERKKKCVSFALSAIDTNAIKSWVIIITEHKIEKYAITLNCCIRNCGAKKNTKHTLYAADTFNWTLYESNQVYESHNVELSIYSTVITSFDRIAMELPLL